MPDTSGGEGMCLNGVKEWEEYETERRCDCRRCGRACERDTIREAAHAKEDDDQLALEIESPPIADLP
jgi:hypothetical protein